MNRVAAVVFTLTGLFWAVTSGVTPGWWTSPAFDRAVLPLPMQAAMWMLSSLILGALWAGHAVKPSLVVAALGMYAIPTTLNGVSIVTFTIEEQNAVSAMGSAIAWLGLAAAAWYRMLIVARWVDGMGARAEESWRER